MVYPQSQWLTKEGHNTQKVSARLGLTSIEQIKLEDQHLLTL